MANSKRRISDIELNELIVPFAPMKCWKVGLYYGSTVYFEMKDRILRITRRGEVDWSGSANLSVCDYGGGWSLYENGTELVDSSDVDLDFVEAIPAP